MRTLKEPIPVLVSTVHGDRETDGNEDLGTWHKLLALSCDLQATGCLIAWGVARAEDTQLHKNSSRFLSSIVKMVCKPHSAREKKSNDIFPFSAGSLQSLLGHLQGISAEAVVQCDFKQRWAEEAWLLCTVKSLNILSDFQEPLAQKPWTALESRAIDSLRGSIQRFLQLQGSFSQNPEDIRRDLKEKRVSYSGEEIAGPEKLTIAQVLPALPPKEHGGCIDILDFVSEGTRELLLHPERLIVKDEGQPLPPLQAKVHVSQPDLLPLCAELVQRGICSWVPWEKVATYRNQKVLSGMFGVRKPSVLSDGRSILRLIMNLVPSNSIFNNMVGSVKGLPSICSLMSLVTHPQEHVECWQSDMVSAFYLFRLPSCWAPFLCFNIPVQGESINEERGKTFVLSCRVLPMGWSSSVAVMQEIAETVLERTSFPMDDQLRRGKPIPPFLIHCVQRGETESRPWWHVYLDNFCAGQKLRGNPETKKGDSLHRSAEAAWNAAGILSSEKKRVAGARETQELGAMINGSTNTISISGERFQKLIQSTWYVVGCQRLDRKEVQIVAGRWIHALQFRRAAMVVLNDTWVFTSGKRAGSALPYKVRRELIQLCMMAPLLQTYLGAQVQGVITASDASTKGGAVGIAKELTPIGEDFVRSQRARQRGQPLPIVVVSLFNGIGGCFRCYDILGVQVLGMIAVEKFKPANRIVARRWPQAKIVWDVNHVDEDMCLKWQLEFPEAAEVHLWAGFPCTDLSSARAGRQGLEGPQSSLFYHIPRVKQHLKEAFGKHVKIKEAVENVASMDRESCDEITYEMGHRPFFLDPVEATPMRRPRLCWTSEDLEGAVQGITFEEERHWRTVHAPANYPCQEDWITPGSTWPGGCDGEALPTAMKAIPRNAPPWRPAGISRCDEDTIARWEADQHRYPPYQYLPQFIFWKGHSWRLANSSERELLLGYGYEHTKLAMSASDQKKSAKEFEDLRCSLLGDSFSVPSFCIVAAALCKRYIPTITYSHLCSRMGMAPGYRAAIRLRAPLKRCLQYGFDSFGELLLGRTNHTGSDVRVSSGEVLNPKSFPRQSIESVWWVWKRLFQTRWKQTDHINALELRSVLLALKYHVTHLRSYDARIFHICDSYVCMSIISKGRTGSQKLQWLLKQLSSILLAFNLLLIIGHVESTDNPTDEASRE